MRRLDSVLDDIFYDVDQWLRRNTYDIKGWFLDQGDLLKFSSQRLAAGVNTIIARELQAYGIISMAKIEKLPQPKRGIELKKWYARSDHFRELFGEHWIINPQGSLVWLLLGWTVQ